MFVAGAGGPNIELPLYPFMKEVHRDETTIKYQVIDSRNGEILAWLDETINPRPTVKSHEPNRKRLKSGHYAVPAPEDGLLDPTSIFVSGLDIRTSKQEILRHFGSLGQITRVTRLHCNATGKFNGSAYVQYKHIASAEQALFLDRSYLRGCSIIVRRKLRSDEERLLLLQPNTDQHQVFENDVNNVKSECKDTIFDQKSVTITNLNPNTTPLELAALFQTVGDIQSVDLNREKLGEAIIRFKDIQGVEGALALNQSPLEGFNICVRRSARNRIPLPPQSVEFNNNLTYKMETMDGNHGQSVKVEEEENEFDDSSIFISNIDHNATDSELAGHFRDVGDIARLSRLRNKATGFNNGKAYIQFKEASSVGWALELHGSYLRDSCLAIQRKRKYNSSSVN